MNNKIYKIDYTNIKEIVPRCLCILLNATVIIERLTWDPVTVVFSSTSLQIVYNNTTQLKFLHKIYTRKYKKDYKATAELTASVKEIICHLDYFCLLVWNLLSDQVTSTNEFSQKF